MLFPAFIFSQTLNAPLSSADLFMSAEEHVGFSGALWRAMQMVRMWLFSTSSVEAMGIQEIGASFDQVLAAVLF